MKKAYRVKKYKDCDDMDLCAWINYYQKNQRLFWYFLHQRIYCRKYTLEHGWEIDDLMQSSVELVIRSFQRRKTIPCYWKHTIFRMAATNAINLHIREMDKFAGRPSQYMLRKFESVRENPGKGFGWVGNGDRVQVTSGNYNRVDLKVDLERTLSTRQCEIVKLLHMGYKQTEIAKMLFVCDRTIRRNIMRIRESLDAAGFRNTI